MIKNTFYNLPPEKRAKIIDVTKKEFLKGNKRKITINTVIEKAGISRGSFYQYFDDKLDLVELVTDDMIDTIIDFIQDELMLNGGDIFQLPARIFDISTVERTEIGNFIALSPESNQNSALISDYMQYRYQKNNYIARFQDYIDTSSLKDNSPENIKCIVIMLFDAIHSAVLDVNKNYRSVEDARRFLNKKVEIIKAGATV